MKTTGYPATGFPLPYLADDADPQAELGQVIAGDDGSEYVYVKAGATALVVGDLQQAPAEDTGDQGITPTAAAVGDTEIVTSSTMTVTANQYAGGYVVVSVTPGISTRYRIKSHSAYTAAVATFLLEEPIQVALTTTSRLDFVANPYNGVVVCPTTRTSTIVGVAVNNITADQYGWLQRKGVCPVLNDAAGALTVGVTVMPSSSVAGSVRLATAGNPVVGIAITGIAASESGAVYLTIA